MKTRKLWNRKSTFDRTNFYFKLSNEHEAQKVSCVNRPISLKWFYNFLVKLLACNHIKCTSLVLQCRLPIQQFSGYHCTLKCHKTLQNVRFFLNDYCHSIFFFNGMNWFRPLSWYVKTLIQIVFIFTGWGPSKNNTKVNPR